ARRAATSRVASEFVKDLPVAGGQSPDQFAVSFELPRIRNTIGALCQRRAARILEIVDPFASHVIVGDAAKVDPAMRILMTEQRREMDECLTVACFPLVTARPSIPEFRREGRSSQFRYP